MARCVACHQQQRITGECMLCHVDPLSLRPVSHGPGFRDQHEALVRSGEQSCAMCHGTNDCQECHDGDLLLVATNPIDHLSPTAPTEGEVREPHVLGRVHSLDYRFTHGLEARSKETECRVCHEPQTFCVECHNPDDEPGRFRPIWHGGSDWGAVPGGVGTGGGRHGELARRDMESCSSCHDVQGADPTCLQCHMDLVPGIGSDPRTHAPGYKKNERGRWHDDPNDICYVCHQASSGAGPGFCTYCHADRN
jgi:hypothetical protein